MTVVSHIILCDICEREINAMEESFCHGEHDGVKDADWCNECEASIQYKYWEKKIEEFK